MLGRTLWINAGDVAGPVEPGSVVKATRPLDDFCLRGDDGSAPVAPGTLLEVVDVRPWGAAMAEELPELHADDEALRDEIRQAALELEAEGLFELVGVS